MNTTRILSLSTLALATAAALTACGGADTPLTGAQAFVSRITPAAPVSQRLRALASTGGGSTAAAAGTITNQQLVSWAQGQYASIFGAGTPAEFDIPYEGKNFHVWAFSTGAYLGVADGVIYGLGAFTGGQLASFGTVASYTCTVDPALCNEPPPPTGSLNECIDPALVNKPAGFQVKLVYVYSGLLTGEWQIDTEIDGPDNFEGQSAIKVTTKTSGTQSFGGFNSAATTTVESFERATSGGLFETLGAITETRIAGIAIPGFPPLPDTTTKLKTVYNPAFSNLEFTLAIGQSITQTHNSTTTVLASSTGTPPVGSVTTGSDTTTWTFEGKESVTVQAGTFNTCRYKESSGGSTSTTWFIVGKGIPAKSQSTEDGQVQTTELKSGTYGGAPL